MSAIPPEENLVPGPAGEGAGPSGVGHRGGSHGGVRSGVQTAGHGKPVNFYNSGIEEEDEDLRNAIDEIVSTTT